jgi:hypothetical protein
MQNRNASEDRWYVLHNDVPICWSTDKREMDRMVARSSTTNLKVRRMQLKEILIDE